MLNRVAIVALCLTCVAFAHTIPSFADSEEYDLVMLAEQEAMGAIPASARLSPKLYDSAEAARKAAEEELAKLGEEVESIPAAVAKTAEQEAINLAADTAADPIHSDLEGIKVNLGHEGAYAPAPVVAPAAVEAEKAEPAAPAVAVDTQNEQAKLQHNEADVPLVKRGHSNTRPSAPQFGVPQMPQMQMPQMQMPQMQMPQMQMPQFPGMQLPQMPQMGQMGQFPGLPDMQNMQMPQMPQMMGMPQFPGMPNMMSGFPQMPQMQNAAPTISSLVAPDFEGTEEDVKHAHHAKSHENKAEATAQAPTNAFNMFNQAGANGDLSSMIPQYQSLFPPSVMQQPQQAFNFNNFFQTQQQLPTPLQGLPLMPNQMSEMMRQLPELLQTMPAQTQMRNGAQFDMPALPAMSDMTKALQSMPQVLPQLMQQLPLMMQQMQQSMMHFAPQMMQQMPQVLQQLPAMPNMPSLPSLHFPGTQSLMQTKDELTSTMNIGLSADAHAHHKNPKVHLAPLTSHKRAHQARQH